MESVHETSEKVRKLEIRGARNIVIAAINTIKTLASQTKAKNKKEFLNELLEAKRILFASRETEPLMRNAIQLITRCVEEREKEKIRDLINSHRRLPNSFLQILKVLRKKLLKQGQKGYRITLLY